MALLRFVNPPLQPVEVPFELAPGNGPPLVAHTVRCLVIHELPHLLLAALHAQSPSSRQPILWLSQRHLLLEESHPVIHAVDTCSRSTWRAITGLLRSLPPCLLSVGSYHAPGFVRG